MLLKGSRQLKVPGDKKAACYFLSSRMRLTVTMPPFFVQRSRTSFRVMTRIGNELRIRHSEVGKEPVGDNGEKDYLFMRLFSLIWLMLKGTGRLSQARNDDPNNNDDEAPF